MSHIQKFPHQSSKRTLKLSANHFAHLRCVAEGVDVMASAKRFLHIEHGHEAKTAHSRITEIARTLARKSIGPGWRLIGIVIADLPPEKNDRSRPTLDEFVLSKELQDWSYQEQTEFYEAEHPFCENKTRRTQRRTQLRKRQLHLLLQLQSSAACVPARHDPVSDWYEPLLAKKMLWAGFVTLGDLARSIATGGCWYKALPAIGKRKAQSIANYLNFLLPDVAHVSHAPVFVLPRQPLSIEPNPSKDVTDAAAASKSMLEAKDDAEAVHIWIETHSGSAATVKSLQRESRVFMLWLRMERGGKGFKDVKLEDCLAFKAFLQHIPDHWISRTRASPGTANWAPFRGQLSQVSNIHLLSVVGGLFAFLKLANYITLNPWPLVNTRQSRKKTAANSLDTKAFSESAQAQIVSFICACPPSAAQARMLFIVLFNAAVGLRASELLAATVGDIRALNGHHGMQVKGKGDVPRIAALSPNALNALDDYLKTRNLSPWEHAAKETPLIASTNNAMESIGYQALYETVRSWFTRAIRASKLPTAERMALYGASTHWLRHTFATRAIERDVPMDVVQAQLGHANISTTMNIYAKAPLQRQMQAISDAF